MIVKQHATQYLPLNALLIIEIPQSHLTQF